MIMPEKSAPSRQPLLYIVKGHNGHVHVEIQSPNTLAKAEEMVNGFYSDSIVTLDLEDYSEFRPLAERIVLPRPPHSVVDLRRSDFGTNLVVKVTRRDDLQENK